MSTQLKLQNQHEALPLSKPSEASVEKGTAHLVMAGAVAQQLQQAMKTYKKKEESGDDSEFFFSISDDSEEEKRLKSLVKKEAALSQKPKGKNAIAEAAELSSKLQFKAQNSLSAQLKNDQMLLQVECEVAEKQAALWNKFFQDWEKFQKDPTIANFKALMEEITAIFGPNSEQGKEAQKLLAGGEKAWNDEKQWKNASGWWRFIHGEWWDPKFWSRFMGSEDKVIEAIAGFADKTPKEFGLFLETMDKMIKNRVRDIEFQIQFLETLQVISSGGGNAVVQMQALMQVMMEMGISNTTKSTERNQILNNFNTICMQEQLQKIEKALKELDSSHHGLWGWVEDFFKSIIQVVERLAHVVEDVVSGNGAQLGKDLENLLGINKIVAAIKEIMDGKFAKGFEDLFLSLATAVVLSNTAIGTDMSNAVKLVVDTIVAVVGSLVSLIAAGVNKLEGNDKDVAKLLSKAADVWTKVLQNPALQAVLQTVMVVMIIASALTGQLYLSAFMTALFLLTVTGALTDLTKDIAKGLTDLGLDSKTAKVIADVLVLVAVTMASLGVGALGAAASAATAEVAEEASIVADEATEAVANSSQAIKEQLAKFVDAIKSVGRAVASPSALGSAAMGFGTSLTSTNFGYDLANDLIKKDKEKWEEILTIIQDVVAAIASIAGGVGLSVGEGTSALDNAISSKISELLNLTDWLEKNNGAILDLAAALTKGAIGVGGMASIENGAQTIYQGKVREDLETLLANLATLGAASDDSQKAVQGLASRYKKLTQEMTNLNSEVYQAISQDNEGVIRALMGQV